MVAVSLNNDVYESARKYAVDHALAVEDAVNTLVLRGLDSAPRLSRNGHGLWVLEQAVDSVSRVESEDVYRALDEMDVEGLADLSS